MPEGNILQVLDYYKNYALEGDEIPLNNYLLSSPKGFPTLRSLVDSQLQAAKPSAARANQPQPTPCSRRKEELFQIQKFTDIDQAAESVQLNWQDDWETLSQKLFRNSTGDLEKVRSAFVFTCRDWNNGLPARNKESSAYRLIRERNYAEIFENLVRAGGVPIERIEGWKKSADSKVGFHVRRSVNPWHACFVSGEWRLVDVHWAASSVFSSRTGRYRELDKDGELSQTLTASETPQIEEKFGRNEFFFLTDPEKLVMSHYPDDRSWQLCKKPIKFEQFEQMPHYFAGSEQAMPHCWQVEPLNYLKNVILAEEEGRVEILFRVPDAELLRDLEFDAKVSIAKRCLSSSDAPASNRLKHGRIIHCDRLGPAPSDIVQVVFRSPCAGKFALTVRIKKKYGGSGWARLATYIVHCPVVDLDATPKPEPKPYIWSQNRSSSPLGRKFPMGNLTREQLAQLRSYPKPPKWEFKAIKAILLMLGFYEGRSNAANDLIIESVHPEIAARCLQLVQSKSGTPTAKDNPEEKASYIFREWVEKNANAVKEVTPPGDFKAADKQRQVQLFGITPEEEAHWDWEDNIKKSEVAQKFICFCDYCHVAIYNNDLKIHLHCNVSRANGLRKNAL
uniref:TGc domain-containing protein n=1 Tax=Macrostomum lignano TaxID=282301 RepID=A0A1I8H736_9PLAT